MSAIKAAVAFDFDLCGKLDQSAFRDAIFNPGVYRRRLDFKHARNGCDATQKSNDFCVGHVHARILAATNQQIKPQLTFILLALTNG